MSKNIMIVGTASGVGKSTLSLALCRVLYENGHAVVPFKAQNISGNAHICADGREMARSQAIAAMACGLEPDPDMNPLLLKPTDGGVEVVVDGRPVADAGGFRVAEGKRDVPAHILAAYRRLESRAELLVLEGAGSPVELNLRDSDISNIKMALAVSAPVILAADISAGGVYASVYGTLRLLRLRERRLVKGIIINKIRGDPDSFADIKTTMEKLTGLPVLGILPYIELKIEDEDNLTDAHTGPKPAQPRDEMEAEFSRLSQMARAHLDIGKIMEIIIAGA